ncbi:tripartite tricarboxylate transporter TctB family protein [Roseinatronobacter sp. NSM]|uniref:tripartite tricarboxylate transporter TctB family protein n=1 Tax=Roseinatronobacter sp. NSM TaxID=3457785 RepID=UPI0040364BA3
MSRNRELVVGLAMLGVGMGYLYMTMQLPRRGAVDATFFPYVLAWAMIGLGALQCLVTWWRGVTSTGGEDKLQPLQALTVLATLGLVAGFIAALRPLGFPIAATGFLFAQFIVLTPNGKRPRLLLYAALAIISAAVIFITFRYGFRLMLPAGPLTPYLP